MPDLIRKTRKNYMYAVSALVGSELFKHIYVTDKQTGKSFDALEGGDGSCAYVVSGLLTLHGLIDRPHATVPTTVKRMLEAGWHETKTPQPGDVVRWPAHEGHMHIGFLIDPETCISNSSMQGVPVRHPLRMADGRMPDAYFTYDALAQNS